jgi:lysozyme
MSRGIALGLLAGGALLALAVPSIAVASVVPSSSSSSEPPAPGRESDAPDVGAANVSAFLAMIQWAEGTARHGDPYRVLYGHAEWSGALSDHPAELGWPGVPLSAVQCQGAGLAPGCVSTAAGAYQITRTTWRSLRRRLGLEDFGPDAQDAAAIELIRERGALDLVRAGELSAAVQLVRRVWASLPGAGYAGQAMRSLAELESSFTASGGSLA